MYARQLGTGNNYFYPVHEFSNDEMGHNLQEQYVNPNLQEILPQAFNKDNFQQGSLDFIVDTSNNFGILWNRSFFRIDATLAIPTSAGATTYDPPKLKDGIAFSQYYAGNLWQSSSFSISNQMIEQTTQYTPQLNVVNNRLGYSGAFLKNNDQLLYSDPSLYNRIQNSAVDNDQSYNEFTPVPLYLRDRLIPINGATLSTLTVNTTNSSTTAGTLTLSVGAGAVGMEDPTSWLTLGIGIGTSLVNMEAISGGGTSVIPALSTLLITGFADPGTYRQAQFTSTGLTAGTATTSNNVLFSTATTTGFSVLRASDKSRPPKNQNTRTALYQPPLSIFSCSEPLAGSFKISLNPHVDANINAIQSYNNSLTFGTDYKITINNIRLYANVVRHTFSPERPIKLKLMPMGVYTRQITSAQSNFEFTVPASSRAFTLFLQDSNVGKNGACSLSPATFRDLAGTTSQILNLQTNYGSISIPSINYNTTLNNQLATSSTKVINVSNPSADITQYQNNEYMRYWDYLMMSGKLFSEGGSESFSEWLDSPIYVFDYSNSENTRATNLTVNLQLATNPNSINPPNLFVVAHYSRVVSGQYKNNILADIAVGDI